ncbi:MAG: tandem-95 repeat protein, partial [Magnetospirillum sp.]|nr:tandem-95 repeat protein [Magnetospirillum sp.]
MADENLNDAPEENANPNGATSENAQQALDDLTVLSEIGNQSLGDSKLNLVRNVDVSDAALGGLANVHQGSGTGNQVQQGLEVQAGLIQTEEIVVEQAPATPVQPPEVPPTEAAEEEAEDQEIIDTAVNLGIQEDLSEANIVFGDGIPTNVTDTGDLLGETSGVEAVAEEVIQDVIPEATLEDAFVDSQPVFGGIRIDVPGDDDPSLVPVPTPLDWTEDTTLTFGIDATDPDGGDVTITFLQPEHGTVTVNADGTYSYEPTQDYFGDDSFTVFVADDEGNVVSQVVELHIANVDDEAVVTVTGGVGTETTSDAPTVVTGTVSATDIDNDNPIAQARVDADGNDVPDITYSFGVHDDGSLITSLTTAHGTVEIDPLTGAYTFTASDNNWGGTDSFTVVTTDSMGGTTEIEVPITVIGSDDATVVTGTVDLGDIAEDSGSILITSQQLLANASDVDNTLHVENLQVSGGTLVDNGNGTWTFTPDADFNGSLDLTYDVVTDTGISTPTSATLDVTAVDDGVRDGGIVADLTDDGIDNPTALPDPLVVTEDRAFTFTIDATDPDGGTLTVSFDQPDHGIITANGDGTYTFTPNADYFGGDDFSYTLTATDGSTTTRTINLDVANVEDEASFTLTGGSGAESTTVAATQVTGSVGASDVDGAVTYSFGTDDNGDAITTLVTDHGSVTIDPATGAYTFTASDNNWAGSDSFTVVTTDSLGGTSTVEVPV